MLDKIFVYIHEKFIAKCLYQSEEYIKLLTCRKDEMVNIMDTQTCGSTRSELRKPTTRIRPVFIHSLFTFKNALDHLVSLFTARHVKLEVIK